MNKIIYHVIYSCCYYNALFGIIWWGDQLPASGQSGISKWYKNKFIVEVSAAWNWGYNTGTLVFGNCQSNLPGIIYFDTAPVGVDMSAKNYLIYTAYCLLAAASGFRFINMLVNNVVKDHEIAKQKGKINLLQKEKEKREKNNQISQVMEAEKIQAGLTKKNSNRITEKFPGDPDSHRNVQITEMPVLPLVKFSNDPQKGRFGGKAENNFRRLTAKVTGSLVPQFYNVSLFVESTDIKDHPLTADVIFYLHDSFSPSVYTVKPENSIAVDDQILSFGAFTVGVITDNGSTMLELDLAENKNFPQDFRDR